MRAEGPRDNKKILMITLSVWTGGTSNVLTRRKKEKKTKTKQPVRVEIIDPERIGKEKKMF